MSDEFEPDDDQATTTDETTADVEEIARQHPSAGDGAEGTEQEGNTEDDEHAADGGPGAGEDYAGSGF